ncbi:MAG: hypothetical protein AAFW70_11330 [Cyanobacteria bacterium J06635_10]
MKRNKKDKNEVKEQLTQIVSEIEFNKAYLFYTSRIDACKKAVKELSIDYPFVQFQIFAPMNTCLIHKKNPIQNFNKLSTSI